MSALQFRPKWSSTLLLLKYDKQQQGKVKKDKVYGMSHWNIQFRLWTGSHFASRNFLMKFLPPRRRFALTKCLLVVKQSVVYRKITSPLLVSGFFISFSMQWVHTTDSNLVLLKKTTHHHHHHHQFIKNTCQTHVLT